MRRGGRQQHCKRCHSRRRHIENSCAGDGGKRSILAGEGRDRMQQGWPLRKVFGGDVDIQPHRRRCDLDGHLADQLIAHDEEAG